MNEQYQPRGFSFLPPAVKNLIIINVLFFFGTIVLERAMNISITQMLGLHFFKAEQFKIYQFVSYMFMHGNISHIFFNMFALWMFGYLLENHWESKKFLLYYFVTGIGAGIVQEVVWYIEYRHLISQLSPDVVEMILTEGFGILHQGKNYTDEAMGSLNMLVNYAVTIGASGAVYGILLAFGMMFPNTYIYIYFLFPIKAKWFVILYGLLELGSGILSSDNVAHFAHLGGMIFGFILIIYWQHQERKKSRDHWQHFK